MMDPRLSHFRVNSRQNGTTETAGQDQFLWSGSKKPRVSIHSLTQDTDGTVCNYD